MNQKFTCQNCGTRFKLDVPENVGMVMCPTCGTNIRVVIDEVGSLGDNFKQIAAREGNWILWAALAFALIWGAIVGVMILSNRSRAPAAMTATPAPPVNMPTTPSPTPPKVTYVPPPAPVVQPPVYTPPTPPVVPATKPTPPPPEIRVVPKRVAVTDADIVAAIKKGIDFLLSNFKNGEIDPKINDNINFRQGLDALAVYALLHCSQSTRDDRISINSAEMKQMIEKLKKFPMVASQSWNDPITYSRSLRASALAIYNRPEDREQLGNDLAWLLRAEQDGAFTYDDAYIRPAPPSAKPPPPAPSNPNLHPLNSFDFDNSNSQYGLIGVWNCAEANLSVPNKFWQDVERHWTSCEQPDGTWGYKSGGSTFAMTMAGITALSVCRDYMSDAATQPSLSRNKIPPRSEALQKALDWFERGNNAVSLSGQHGYSLYGLERAALASGMMFAGAHDIYREMATQEVHDQHPNGAWRADAGQDAIIETSFSLLFLARGRNPVMMNKLRYDGNWANHQRDAANLARFATYAMERPVNWQIVTLNQPWASWMESPVLFISGDVPPTFGPADYERLKSYVANGGLIFTQSDNGSDAFNAFARDLAAQLFPKYEYKALADDDPIFNLQFSIPAPHPRMWAVSNGTRKMMIHCMDDVAASWQANLPKRDAKSFQLGLNIFVYATGKAELRTKTDSPYILPPEGSSGRTVHLARIVYSGNWDPEPAAFDRFSRYFWWDTGWTLDPAEIAAGGLQFSDTPIAYLTGTTGDKPSAEQIMRLQKFVSDGGTLIIDCAGGSFAWHESVRKNWLAQIAPGAQPLLLPEDSPILTGKIPGLQTGASELPRILIRPYAAQVTKPANTRLLHIKAGKGDIYFSEVDITTGLLGTNTWGITGYSPAYAQALLKNVILHAVQTAPPSQ